MCLPRGIDIQEGSSGGGSGCSADQLLPDKAYKPKSGVVESYTHSKKVGNYLIGRDLGAGSFATVREGLHVTTGERVAIKVISKETAKTDTYVAKNMRREGRILQLIRHSNVVQLLEVMETENSYYLVLELCQGGDFMTHLVKRRRLTEAETRRYLRQIVQAVDYLHSLGILHRDLKIENLLLTQDQKVKIIDFGLSNLVQAVPDESGNIVTQLCRTQCGSPAYAAPEVLAKKPYGTAVDVWSIGVNMFAMLTGNLPFTVKPYSIKALHHKMVNQELNPLPKALSAGCRDLLMRLLNPQPETRIKLRDVMNHPWLNESVSQLRPSPFPNLPTREDLRQDVLQQVSQQLALPVAEVARKVLDNSPSPCLSTYHLLVIKADRYCRQNPIAKIKSQIQCDEECQQSPTGSAAAQAAAESVSAEKSASEDANHSSPVDPQLGQESPQAAESPPPPPLTALPRRGRTFAGYVPLSAEAAETCELVSLDRGATSGSQSGSQTVRLPQLSKFEANSGTPALSNRYHRLRTGDPAATPPMSKPRTPPPERWAQSDRGCRTARGPAGPPRLSQAPLPRRIPTDSSGRSSIQSLVTQRFARGLTMAEAPPSRYQPSGSGGLSALSAGAAAAAAAAAALAAARRPPQKASAVPAARRFSSAALRCEAAAAAVASSEQFIQR